VFGDVYGQAKALPPSSRVLNLLDVPGHRLCSYPMRTLIPEHLPSMQSFLPAHLPYPCLHLVRSLTLSLRPEHHSGVVGYSEDGDGGEWRKERTGATPGFGTSPRTSMGLDPRDGAGSAGGAMAYSHGGSHMQVRGSRIGCCWCPTQWPSAVSCVQPCVAINALFQALCAGCVFSSVEV
jgi:hypothetical protein